jgi:hypothetical protein
MKKLDFVLKHLYEFYDAAVAYIKGAIKAQDAWIILWV